ncbi:MAG: DUF1761 domain-containing protein [Pseudomonadota bacterium]
MNIESVNWLAVIAAGFAAFAIGGIWYSPLLLGKHWLVAANLRDEDLQASGQQKIFAISLLATLVMSSCLALLLNSPLTDSLEGFYTASQQGAFYGLLVGLGLLFFAFVVVGMFERRSWHYIAINGGYWIVAMTTMGGILGAWR